MRTQFEKNSVRNRWQKSLVILDDADLGVAVECAVNDAFYSTGQRYTATSRSIVTEQIYPAFAAAIIERIKALKVGAILNSVSQISLVVDQCELDKNLRYIAIGKEEGDTLIGENCRLVCGALRQLLKSGVPRFALSF